jgi:hypothetical protein
VSFFFFKKRSGTVALLTDFFLGMKKVAGVNVVLGSDISHKDSIVSYLPLAHVLEFTVENACMFWGVT